jgi:hypothetical protein
MKAAAARKVSVRNLEERVRALMEEINEILDQLAETRRPKGEGKAVPQGWLRMQMDVRGGHCLCRSYLATLEENN